MADFAAPAEEAIGGSLFQNMRQGCALCRVLYEDGRPVDWLFLEANPAYLALTGLPRVAGRRISELLPALLTTSPEVLATYGAVAGGQGPRSFEMRVRPLGIWVSVHAFSPRPGHFIATLENITAAKEAQAALAASEQRYRLVTENALDETWTMDLEGRFTYISPSVERMRGFTQAEAMVQTLEEVLVPEAAVQARRMLREAQAAHAAGLPIPEFGIEWEEYRKDGSTVWTEVRASGLLDESGRTIGFAGITRDITERKRMEAQQRALQTRVEALQRLESVGLLASGISQEMNNVLATIMALASIVEIQGGEAAAKAKVILKASRHGRAIVKALQDFSRQDPIGLELLDLNALARREADLISRIAHRGIVIHEDLPSNPGRILGDEDALANAIRNVCLNAVEAMPEGGSLTLRTRFAPGGACELTIEDTGCGMTEAVRSRALDPFFTTKPFGKGTGLGLSAVFGTVRAHAGTLELRSTPGQGTQVLMTFPGLQGR